MWGKKVQAGTFRRVNELGQKIAQKTKPNLKNVIPEVITCNPDLCHHYLILVSYMNCASYHLSSPIVFLHSTLLQLSSCFDIQTFFFCF